MGRYQVNLIVLLERVLNGKRATELSVCRSSQTATTWFEFDLCSSTTTGVETTSLFFSFPLGEHSPANFSSLSFVRTAMGKKFSNLVYPLSENLLLSLHVYRATIPFGPCSGIEVRVSILGTFSASLIEKKKKNHVHLKTLHISVDTVNIME